MKHINFYILILISIISFSCSKLNIQSDKLEGVYVNSSFALEVLELQSEGKFRMWANCFDCLTIEWPEERQIAKKPFEIGSFKVDGDKLTLSFINGYYKNYKILKYKGNYVLRSNESSSADNIFFDRGNDNLLIKHQDNKIHSELQTYLDGMVINNTPVFMVLPNSPSSRFTSLYIKEPPNSDYLGYYRPKWFKSFTKSCPIDSKIRLMIESNDRIISNQY